MKKVFMQFGSGLGPMSRSLPIALELAKNGFEVRYLGYSSAKKYMEKAGIKEIDSIFSISDITKGVPNPHWNTADTFWTMIGYGNMPWLETKIEQLIKIVKDYNPDYIFSDLGILACLVARILNIPLIAMNQSCYYPTNKLKWWTNVEYDENELRDKLNDFLAKHNAKKLNTFTEIFTGDLTVIPSFYDFDKISEEGLNKYNGTYIGPILWFSDKHVDDNISNILSKNNNRKKIFCYTARFTDNVGKSGEVIFDSVFSVAKDIDADFVISTGNKQDYDKALSKVNNIPSNVYITDYVPLEVAYENSDIVIHHGGHGSCLAQFYFNKPGLIIPTHSEREHNARVCKKLGVSEFLERENLSDKNIQDKISMLLANKKYKENIEKINKENLGTFNNLEVFIEKVKNLESK